MSYFGTIYADPDLLHRARAVYMYLRDRADGQGICWPGIKTIGVGPPWTTQKDPLYQRVKTEKKQGVKSCFNANTSAVPEMNPMENPEHMRQNPLVG